MAFPDSPLPVMVEAAFGADLAADPQTWQWTDLTDRLLDQPIRISRGRTPGAREASAASASVTLLNDDQQLTPLHPGSVFYPHVDLGTPIRITVTRNSNPDFRDGVDGWAADGGSISRSTVARPGGLASLQLTPDGIADTAVATSELAPVRPGRLWLVSGWVMSPAGYPGPAGVVIDLLDGDGQLLERHYASSAPLPANTWTYQERMLEIPSDAAYARVGLAVGGSPSSTDVIHGDQLRIRAFRAAGEATSWQLGVTPVRDGQVHSTVTVTIAGPRRRLGAGRLLRSAIYRSTIVEPSLVAYWPLEDGAEAEVAASAVPGAAPATFIGRAEVQTGAEQVAPGSGPSVRLTAGVDSPGSIRCPVPGRPGPGWVVSSVFAIEPETLNLAVWQMTVTDGNNNQWIAQATPGSNTLTVSLTFVDPDGVSTTLASEQVTRNGPHQVMILADTTNANVARRWILVVDGATVASGTATFDTPPTSVAWPRRVDISANDLLVGHVAVHDESLIVVQHLWRAVQGWHAEPATGRVARLCAEQRIPLQLPTGEPLIIDRTTEIIHLDEDDPIAFADLGGDVEDVDLLITAMVDDAEPVPLISASLRMDANFFGYELMFIPDEGFGDGAFPNLAIFRTSEEDDFILLAEAIWPGGTIRVNTPYSMRAQAIGDMLRLRLWPADEPEPLARWDLVAHDSTYRRGSIGVTLISEFEEDVTVTVSRIIAHQLHPSQPMGPQPVGALLDILGECETADDGILHETPFGFGWRPVASRYNQTPALTVDMATYRHTGRPEQVVTPLRDDLGLANTIAVERPGGSLVVAQDLASVARYQGYALSVEANVALDAQLPHIAMWELAKGTRAEMRPPARHLDLMANPDLVDAWLGTEIGDLIRRVNLPTGILLGPVDRQLTAYTETLQASGEARWLVNDDGVPDAPYRVAVLVDDGEPVEPDEPRRYNPGTPTDPGMWVAAPFTAGAGTSLTVRTTVGPQWTLDPDHCPFDISVRHPQAAPPGVRLRVTEVTDIAPSVLASTGAGSGTTDSWTINTPVPAGGTLADLEGRPMLLFHVADVGEPSTMGTPTGGAPWHRIGLVGNLDGSGDGALRAWWKVAGPDEPATIALTQDPDADGAAVVLVLDAHPTWLQVADLIRHAPGTSVTSTSHTAWELRNQPADALDIRVLARAGGGTLTPPVGWTNVQHVGSANFVRIAVAVRLVTTGTATGDVTWSATNNSNGQATATVAAFCGRQTLTVLQQPLDGLQRQIPTGWVVELANPGRYAL